MQDLTRIEALLGFVDYCRTEARDLDLSLSAYLLDVARLSLAQDGGLIEKPVGAGEAKIEKDTAPAELLALIRNTPMCT